MGLYSRASFSTDDGQKILLRFVHNGGEAQQTAREGQLRDWPTRLGADSDAC
jgi:hypothetical protein